MAGRHTHIMKRLEEEGYNAWIGVDLDGTLAEYYGWVSIEYIGKPIPAMVNRVKRWLNDGKNVKVFTARVHLPESIPYIEKWLKDVGLGGLEITNVKDFQMIELWDDRAVRVSVNTGTPCCSKHLVEVIK